MPLTGLHTRAARDSVRNFLTAQDSGFRYATGKDGGLVEDGSIGKIRGRLVAWVEKSPGRNGVRFGRVIRTLVGPARYAHISRQIKSNRDASISNMLRHFVPGAMGEDRKNQDLRVPIEDEKQRELMEDIKSRLESTARVTTSDFDDMAQGIKSAINKRRGEAREQAGLARLVETILDRKALTPAMKALNKDERRVAVLAMSSNCTPEQALDSAPEIDRGAVQLEKISAVMDEKQSLDAALDAAHDDISKGLLEYYDLYYHGGKTPADLERLSGQSRDALDFDETDDVSVEMETAPEITQFVKKMRGNEETTREKPSVEKNFRVNKNSYAELLMNVDGLSTGHRALENVYGADQLRARLADMILKLSSAAGYQRDDELSELSRRAGEGSHEANNIKEMYLRRVEKGLDGSDLVARSRTLLGKMQELYQNTLAVQKRRRAQPSAQRQAPEASHYRAVGVKPASSDKAEATPAAEATLLEVETHLDRMEGELGEMLLMAESREKLAMITDLYLRVTDLENRLGPPEEGMDASGDENSRQNVRLETALSTCAGFREQVVEALFETNRYLDPGGRQEREQVLQGMIDTFTQEVQRRDEYLETLGDSELVEARMRDLRQQLQADVDEIVTPAGILPSRETEV